MSSLPVLAPVRHGKCRLILAINDVQYIIRRRPPVGRGVKVWSVKHAEGARKGLVYSVVVAAGQVACTCPDSVGRGAHCKHVRAMQAVGLINPRLEPSSHVVAAALASEEGVAHV